MDVSNVYHMGSISKYGVFSEYDYDKGDYADKQYEPLSNIPKIGSFAVKDSKEDMVAPTVTSVNFKLPEGKTVADPGDEIEVSVQAEDNPGGTGLRAVRFYLRNENGDSTDTIEVDADENGNLKDTFTVGDSWGGTYDLNWLRVYDKAEGTGWVGSYNDVDDNYRGYVEYNASGREDIKSITSNPFTVKGKPATPIEDTEDPVLKSITIELPDGKTTASPGDTIKIVAEATDNKTKNLGVKINSSLDPTDDWYIYLNKNEQTGKYVAEVTVTDEWDNGEYGIDWVELNDYNGNRPWYYDKNYSSDVTADRDLANIPGTKRFKVTGSKEDHQPPVVKSVSINKYNDTDGVTVYQNLDQEPYPQFSPGDKIVFSATLADESDISDNNELYIYLWDTNARTATITLKRQADGTFSGETTVTDRWTNSGDSKEGKSHHNLRVYASDEFGNDTEGNLPLVGKIRIIGSKEDNDGPVLNSVTIDKTEAKPGDTITITANITDANSKGTPVGVDTESVYGSLSFYYADDEKDDYHYFDMIKQSDGTYQGTVKVNDSWYNYAENGNTAYKLYIGASDTLGNGSGFTSDVTKKEVRINGSKEDIKGPVVKSVKFDKTQAKPGDTVTMSVDATDETGIDNVYVVVYNDMGSEEGDDDFTPVRGRIRVKPDSTGKLSAGISVDNSFKNGIYKVLRVSAGDVLDNYKYYHKDKDGRIVGSGHWDDDKDEYVYDEVVEVGEFTVKDSPGVYAGSRLKSVTFDNRIYDSGATGHVTAVLEDPDADVKHADILVGVKADGRGGGLRAMSTGAIEVDGAEETFEVRLYPTEKGILEADFDVPEKESSWDREYGGSPVFNVLSALVEDNNNNIMYYTANDYVYDPEKDDYVPGENNISNILTNTFVIDEEEEEEKPADYSKVDEAISFIPAALDKYTEESIDVLNEALKKVVRGKDSTEQATVDGYAKEIQDAIDALVPKDASEPADYKRVDEAIARIPADKSMYTQESVKAVDDAVNAVIRGKKINEQPKVNDYARVINEAVRNLVKKPADYTKTDAAIAGMPADTSIYTPDSVKAASDAIAAVIRDKKIDEQADVDAFTKAIEDAIAALVLKDADYSKVNEAKSKIPTDEYLKDCTEQSVQALKDAVAAVVEGKKADEQNTVDGYAGAIEAAITALELKPADYTQVDIAKASVPEDLSIYTDDSVKALNDAIAAVIADKKINEQDIVNEYAGAIDTAVRSLVIKDADYSDVDAVKALIPPAEELEKYTDESVCVLMAAVDAVVEGKKADEQATVDDYAKAIEEAIAALVLKPEEKTDDGDTETPDNSGDTETPDNTGDTETPDNTDDTETPGDADDNEAPDENGGTDITDDNAPEDNGTQNEDGTQDDGKVAQDGSDKSTAAGTANVGVVTPASTGRVSAGAPVSSGTVITSTNSNSAPATGKKNHLPIWLAAAGAAAAAMAGAIIKRKKKTEEK